MKRAFIIPTWGGHFDKNITFLKSCIDYNIKTPIKIVVSNESEKISLQSMVENIECYENLDLEIIEIEKVINKFKPEIKLSDIEDLKLIHLRALNIFDPKHPYQAIKKIYALRYFDYDQAMLLDSECAFVKPTNADELFDEYFESPQIFYTPHENLHPNLRIFTNASQQCLRWANVELVKDMWVFENLYWMVDKNIFNDMLNDIESNLGVDIYTEFVNNPGEIFDMIVYYSYIYINNKRYNYQFVNFYTTIKKYLENSFDNYFLNKAHRLGGALEFMFENVNKDNFEGISNFVNDYKIRFCRPDFCDLLLYKSAVKNSLYLNMILASEKSTQLIDFLKR